MYGMYGGLQVVNTNLPQDRKRTHPNWLLDCGGTSPPANLNSSIYPAIFSSFFICVIIFITWGSSLPSKVLDAYLTSSLLREALMLCTMVLKSSSVGLDHDDLLQLAASARRERVWLGTLTSCQPCKMVHWQ